MKEGGPSEGMQEDEMEAEGLDGEQRGERGAFRCRGTPFREAVHDVCVLKLTPTLVATSLTRRGWCQIFLQLEKESV